MKNVQVIYKSGVPFGIRDENGFLLFFPRISKFTNQEQRYQNELDEQRKLSNYLLTQLKKM